MTNRNLASNSLKNLVKDVIIIVIAIAVIWIGLQVIFGTANPFYVVSSGSMIPTLEVYDVIIVEGNTPFEDVKKGDIIVFYSPAKYELGEERVIVHRVEQIIEEDPKVIKTRGDNNPRSIQGTDFPITEREYIGKVEYTVPQVGYVTKILQPPVNYIIIAIIVGVMVLKHFAKKKEVTFQHTLKDDEIKSENNEISDIALDKEYVEKTEEPKESKLDNLDDTKSEDDTR